MADIVTNGKLLLKQRTDLIRRFFLDSNIEVVDEKEVESGFHLFNITFGGKHINVYVLSKNIVNSGWKDKPFIKRIQITSFINREIEKNTNDSCSLFLGICFVNEEPIFVVWNPFMFVFHRTNRSCYVDIETIARTFYLGYLKTSFAKKNVFLCDSKHFDQLLNDYLERSAVE